MAEDELTFTEQWVSPQEARDMIRQYLATSEGRAHALLQAARASGEVRYQNDDGVIRDPRFDWCFSRLDLEDWLKRQAPQVVPVAKAKTGKQYKRDLARKAIKALWPGGLPERTELQNGSLCTQVNDRIINDCKRCSVPAINIGDDTILRAANRK